MIEKKLAQKAVQKKRKDSEKNFAKVIKEVLKDPDATQREIAENAGIGLGTVNRQLEQLEQTEVISNTIDRICANDRELMDLVAGLNVREIKKIIEKPTVELNDLKTINSITQQSTTRYTLFKGTVTDDEGGLKKLDTSEMDNRPLDEVLGIIKDLLNKK